MNVKPKRDGNKSPPPNVGLVGRFFHTFDDDNRIRFQGVVRSYLGDGGYYLVQTFSFATGEPWDLMVVHIRELQAWRFYDDAEQMKYFYQYVYREPRELTDLGHGRVNQ